MTKKIKLSDLLHDIKEPTTAAEALEAARKLRAASDRLRKHAAELEAKEAEEREAAERALTAEIRQRLADFVLSHILDDAASLSVFEAFGEKIAAEANEAFAKVSAAEMEKDRAQDGNRANALAKISKTREENAVALALFEKYGQMKLSVDLRDLNVGQV